MMIVNYEDEDDGCLRVFTESVKPSQLRMLPGLGC